MHVVLFPDSSNLVYGESGNETSVCVFVDDMGLK